jgi:hypothetical protein
MASTPIELNDPGSTALKTLKRVLVAAAMSWSFSVTLGLLFAVCVASPDLKESGHFWFYALRLPGVVPVALIVGTAISILMTPLATWSVRTGVKNLLIYAPILWIALATYIFAALVIWKNPAYGLYGVACLGAVGAAALGFIPPTR